MAIRYKALFIAGGDKNQLLKGPKLGATMGNFCVIYPSNKYKK